MKFRFASFLAAVGLTGFAHADPVWASRFPGEFGGLKSWQWVGLLVLIGLGLLVSFAVRFTAHRLLLVRQRLTGTATGATGARSIRRGAAIFGFVLPYYLFSGQVELTDLYAYRINLLVQCLTVLATVMLIYGIWDAICDAIAHRAGSVANAERLLIPVTRKLVRFFILTAGLLLALGVFGVNITGLLAGVGIGGLVVALAAKDSVENVFGSLTILFDMPFALGDWVKIDKAEGIVEEINLRSTKIRTFEDSMITLPNSNLIKAAVENYGARRYRRQRFFVRVSNANKPSHLERFLDAVRASLQTIEGIIHDRTIVELNDLTEASTGILVQCFIEAASFKEEAAIRGRVLMQIFQAANATGTLLINTPVPPPDPEPQPEPDEEERKRIEDEEDII